MQYVMKTAEVAWFSSNSNVFFTGGIFNCLKVAFPLKVGRTAVSIHIQLK